MSITVPSYNSLTVQQQNFTADKIALIKNTVAQGATDMELQLFIEQCKRTGLDPITRQIYFIKDKKGKVQVQTSIDGFRLIADRSGEYRGQTQPLWCGEDGVWKDVWLNKKVTPSACKVGVYKKDFNEPLYAIALFDEYAQKSYDGSLTFMWSKMPALMIAKVAESLALRKAFPNDLSGLYTSEEMGQADNEPAPLKVIKTVEMPVVQAVEANQSIPASYAVESVSPETTTWDAGTSEASLPSLDEYRVPFGKKHKGKTLMEIGLEDVISFTGWLMTKSAETGKPLEGDALIFTQMADKFALQNRTTY